MEKEYILIFIDASGERVSKRMFLTDDQRDAVDEVVGMIDWETTHTMDLEVVETND